MGIFLFLPKSFLKAAAKFIDINLLRIYEQEMHFERFRQAGVGRLREISNVFKETGEMFFKAAEQNISAEPDITYVLDELAQSNCAHCIFAKSCWSKDFLNTYQEMKNMYLMYETEGRIEKSNISSSFLARCMDADKMIAKAEEIFASFILNLKWKRKIEESRFVTGKQLLGVSRVISHISEEMSFGIEFSDECEAAVKQALKDAGIAVKEVVAEVKRGFLTIDVRVSACGGNYACSTKMLPIINGIVKRNMKLIKDQCYNGKKVCELRFEQQRRINVLTGAATGAKSGVSGDAHSFLALDDARYLVVMCDGMGKGERARRESDAAVSLIKNFYRAGFDDNTVFDTINRLMLLKGTDDMFSTVDLIMIDPIESQAHFTKIGAERSFIIRNEKILTVEAGSLPIGILEDVEPKTHSKNIYPNDIIIMMTDGVSDLYTNEELEQLFGEEINGEDSPDETAQKILSSALKKCEGEQKDDMTVVVVKIGA